MAEKSKLLIIGSTLEKLPHLGKIAQDLDLTLVAVADRDDVSEDLDCEDCLLVVLDLGKTTAEGIADVGDWVIRMCPDQPVVFAGLAHDDGVIAGFDAGAYDVFRETIEDEVLSVRVRNLLDRLLKQQALNHENERLVQMSLRMKKYVGHVAHDLRGPLGKLINTSEVLLSGVEADSQEAFFSIIARTSRRGFELVNNILDITSLESGQLRIEKGKCNLSVMADQVITELNYLASEKEIGLRNRILMPLEVYADAQRVIQVLSNLITNAIKFTPRFGTVTLQAKPGVGGMRIQVVDTGVGINQETVDRLFDLESKTSTLGTEGERGTGLGLAIAQEIIKGHDSQITVTSMPDEGSTFSFQLPMWQVPDE